jgi:hypothetical protein
MSVLIMYSTGIVTLKNNVTAYHLTSSTIELQYNLANPLKEIHLIIQFYLEHCVTVQKNCVQTSKHSTLKIHLHLIHFSNIIEPE